MNVFRSILQLCCSLLSLLPIVLSAASPIADVHTHYKWSQADVTSPKAVAKILRDHQVALAVVIGMPDEYALRVKAEAPDIVVPIWSPYRKPGDWASWPHDRQVLQRALP